MSISYTVDVNDKFSRLTTEEQKAITGTFIGAPYYTFSLSTHSKRFQRTQRQILQRLVEFKHLYLSLTSYVYAELQSNLSADIAIKIQGIDYWPHANYAEKYFTVLCEREGERYENLLGSYFDVDVRHYAKLHQLSYDSKSRYHKGREFFKVTDVELASLRSMELYSIRWILLSHNVPIKAIGDRVIEKIYIHVHELIAALGKEYQRIESEKPDGLSYFVRQLMGIERLIEYLYDNHAISEKAVLIQEQKLKFVESFPIQNGDVLELQDGRLVIAEHILVDEEDNIDIEYCLLKNNLEKGTRKRTLGIHNLSSYLKERDFQEYKQNVPIKRLSLLKGWIKKRKLETPSLSFRPRWV